MSYATNPKAKFDYEILDKLEAGLVLTGFETKAVRAGKISIKGAFVRIIRGEALLVGATISPYQPNNTPEDYDQQRSRKLLLKKSELNHLVGKTEERGITLIPLSVFDKHGMIKLEIGIGRGKKKFDKRESIKKRDFNRDKARALRSRE